MSGLVRDRDGNLYGTTIAGGNLSDCGGAGCGVVFKVDPNGHETVLYSFTGPDGANPYGNLLRDGAGNLYGTTNTGGASNAGVVFKVDATGHETVLYSFTGGADGANPFAGVIRDGAGNLYGTASGGGTSGNGVVFKVDPSGHETVLHNFAGGTDGNLPYAPLIADQRGNLYGTTFFGGTGFFGVVFKIDPSGRETVLYNFTGFADGGTPSAGLLRDNQGNLYGTTNSGGDLNDQPCIGNYGCGVVFKLSVCRTATCHGEDDPDSASATNSASVARRSSTISAALK